MSPDDDRRHTDATPPDHPTTADHTGADNGNSASDSLPVYTPNDRREFLRQAAFASTALILSPRLPINRRQSSLRAAQT